MKKPLTLTTVALVGIATAPWADRHSHVRIDFRHVDTHMHRLMAFYGGRDFWAGERRRR